MEWDGYVGKIVDSQIFNIGTLIANDGLTIINSTINTIKSKDGMTLRGRFATFINVTIEHIEREGLVIQTRNAALKNVIIRELKFKSIFVDKDYSLKMENVIIESAEEKSIFAEYTENLIIKNVTINGEKIEFNSNWIMSESKNHLLNENDILVSQDDSDHCILAADQLTCDYKGVQEVCKIAKTELSYF